LQTTGTNVKKKKFGEACRRFESFTVGGVKAVVEKGVKT